MDEITKKLGEMNTAVEELRSTSEANLQQRDVLLEQKETALNTRINELSDQIAELTRNAVRPAVNTSEEKSNFAAELRAYALTGVSTRAVTTQTGADAAAIGAAGGYLVETSFDRNIVKLAQDISPLVNEVSVQSAANSDIKFNVDLGGTGSSWVSETGTNGMHSPTNTPTFAEVTPPSGILFAKPLLSLVSLNDIYFDIEAHVNQSVATKFAKDVGAAILNGTGSGQPKGLLTYATAATADLTRAFGTIQHIASGTAGALPAANTYADKYQDMITALNPIYRLNAKWYVGRAVAGEWRKLRDANGQPLWIQSFVAGQPSTFLGYPVVEVEDMPAVAANSLSVMFGDLKQAYRLYDIVGTTMLRDPYSYDAYVALKTWKRFAGAGANTEAVKVLKCSAS